MPQAPLASTPTEVLAGLVDRVTFHNAENGFCVLRVKARGERDLITVLGQAAMISAGEFVQGPCHGNANEHALRACNWQGSGCRGSNAPLGGSFGSEGPQCGPRDEVALQVVGVLGGGMHAEKALGGASRLEPLQLALASSHRLMRVFGSVVPPEPLFMMAAQP